MDKIEEMLQEIILNQKKLANEISNQRKLIENIEERLRKFETEITNMEKRDVPASLVRVLKGLADENRPISAEETAKRINLSRNLTSGYLNKLANLGYVTKEPNLEGKGARYRFKINYAAIPDHIKQMLKKYGQ